MNFHLSDGCTRNDDIIINETHFLSLNSQNMAIAIYIHYEDSNYSKHSVTAGTLSRFTQFFAFQCKADAQQVASDVLYFLCSYHLLQYIHQLLC